MKFNEKQIHILKVVATEVEKAITESRKGVPQGYYVIFVDSNEEIFCSDKLDFVSPPKELLGYWKMSYLGDVENYSWKECLDRNDWVKVSKKQIITYEWSELS